MKPQKKIALVLILFISNISFAQEYDFKVSKIPVELLVNANSVVRIDDVSIELQSQNSMVYKVKKATTVFNKLADYNNYIQVYFDKRVKIKHIETYAYDAYGNEIKKVKKSDYQDISAVDGNTLFGDSRMLYYKYTPVSYPYTIYCEYEIETSNTALIPRWTPLMSYYSGVELSTFSLTHAADLKIQINERNFGDYLVEKEVSEDAIKFSLKNIVPIKEEPLCPSFEDMVPYVKFATNKFSVEGIEGQANDWIELGAWQYKNFYDNNNDLSNSTKDKVLNLVEGVDDPIERAKIIYDYVQNKTRYISVQVGIGGLKPMAASQVDQLGYGDCKALVNYTKSLLDVVEVPAYFTELYGGYEKQDMDYNFPSIHGNHVILNLPSADGDIWLECTSQKVPFGYIANFTDDRDVIVIKPEGGFLKHTKKYLASENSQIINGNYEIDDEGAIKASIKITSKGTQYDDDLQRKEGVSNDELIKLYKNDLAHINNIQLTKIDVFNNKKESSFEEEIEFEASNYINESGTDLLIPINAFNRSSAVPVRVRNRKLPFEITYSYLDIDEIEIKIPSTLKIVYLPESNVIETKYGNYTVELSKLNETTYLYKRTVKIKEGKYTKEEYDLYRDFRKKIRKYDNSKIILKRKVL